MRAAQRSKVKAAIAQLIIDRRFSVARQGKDLLLIKTVARRPIMVLLKYTDSGYWIEPPKHEYLCTYSHFEFTEPEERCTRRKDILMQVVGQLQKTRMWEHIVNKAFFVPNKANKKVSQKIVRDQYRSIMGPVKED